MNKKTIVGEVTLDYLEKYPDEFKRALARRMFRERPDIFNSHEHARSSVRYYTGAIGDKDRKKRGLTKEGFIDIKRVMSQYYLKQEHTKGTGELILPSNQNKIGLLSDLHIPYHETSAIETAIDYMYKKGINTIILNGDLVDFYKISRWSKDPHARSFEYERDMALEFFEFLRAIFPDATIYWKIGNHEERYEQFMRNKAPELLGLDEFELNNIFSLDDYNIQIIPGRKKIKAGKLNILHGHEFGQSFFNPVNPARGLFLRAKTNAIAGHNHQSSEHHENNLDGNPIGCWSTGCLCHLDPEYRPFGYTKWNHGAAIIETEESGSFVVDNFRIIDGKVR